MVLDSPEIFLVTSVSLQVIALNVFSIPYVCYADFSSFSMYFPFVTLVTLISAGTRKILFLSFHIVNGQKDVLSLTLPLLHLLHLLQGIRWPSIFSCNHSQLFFIISCATFVTLIC